MLNVERFCISTVYIIIIRMSFSASNNLYYCHYCGCPACVCVPVRSFLSPRASRPRNIGTYVFTVTRNTFIYLYNRDFLLKMLRSEATASFACLECH